MVHTVDVCYDVSNQEKKDEDFDNIFYRWSINLLSSKMLFCFLLKTSENFAFRKKSYQNVTP